MIPCLFWLVYASIGSFCAGVICAIWFIEWSTRKGYSVYEKRGE